MTLWRVLGIDELGSVCRQHLLVGTSAANALDALAKFIGRSVPFVWNEESQWLYQSCADRLGGAAKAHSVTRMLQAIRLKMLFDSDVKHLKSASSVCRALERTEEYWGRTPEISDGKSGFVADLVVAKDMRGTGVGKALLFAAEKYFATNDCVRFELTVFAPNKSAYSFYVKQGFEPRLHHMIRKIER